jgi:hypothetical protein
LIRASFPNKPCFGQVGVVAVERQGVDHCRELHHTDKAGWKKAEELNKAGASLV